LYLRIPEKAFGDGTIWVVDDHLGLNGVEELKGLAVAGKSGRYPLTRGDLGVKMTAEAQGHHEDPGFECPASVCVGNFRFLIT
jgi:hypothetical protein